MDVNHFLAREQVELALARAALSPGARASHQSAADHLRVLLDDHRRAANDRAQRVDRPAFFTGAAAA